MSGWTKLLFILVASGLVYPALKNVFQAGRTRRDDWRYDRTRNTKVKPVGEARYRHLWVVDRDEEEQ